MKNINQNGFVILCESEIPCYPAALHLELSQMFPSLRIFRNNFEFEVGVISKGEEVKVYNFWDREGWLSHANALNDVNSLSLEQVEKVLEGLGHKLDRRQVFEELLDILE
jgi:hypothetical protein